MAADLIDRLRALSRHEHSDTSIGDEAADALEAAREDAERYRWLRKFSDHGGHRTPAVPTLAWDGNYSPGWCDRIDAAIDAARAQETGHD